MVGRLAVAGLVCAVMPISSALGAQESVATTPVAQAPAPPAEHAPGAEAATSQAPQPGSDSLLLPAGTLVPVTVDADIATSDVKLGDKFGVHVSQDVKQGDTILIPKGVSGQGTVTFVTKNGGFGKAGILGIALNSLTLSGREIPLDGHFREEGRNKNGATAATFFAVGIFAAAIRGKGSVIPAGRELRGHLAEDTSLSPWTGGEIASGTVATGTTATGNAPVSPPEVGPAAAPNAAPAT